MSVRIGTLRKPNLILVVLSVLAAFGLAVAPVPAHGWITPTQAGDLLVADQTANTIQEFSPTGKTWATSPRPG